MNNLPEYLLSEYNMWAKELNEFDTEIFKENVSTQEVLQAYYILVDYFHSQGEELNYGIKDFNLISSAVSRQFTSWNGKQKWTDKYTVAATLFYGLNKNHAFSDGNKRTSMLVLLYYLIKNNFIFCGDVQKSFERLAVKTADNKLSDYPYYSNYRNKPDAEIFTIAHVIKKNIRKADKAYVAMTYQEFLQKIKKYNFDYSISGGYVTIYRYKQGLFRKKSKSIIQVGCPGLKKQINHKAAKEVLKACELSYEHGYDFKSFLDGNQSMYRLINDFEGPLRRLKDR